MSKICDESNLIKTGDNVCISYRNPMERGDYFFSRSDQTLLTFDQKNLSIYKKEPTITKLSILAKQLDVPVDLLKDAFQEVVTNDKQNSSEKL